MNKNQVIGILAVLLVLGSLWGQVGNKTKKSVAQEKKAVEAQLAQVKAESAKTHDALLLKTAQLQKTHQNTKTMMTKTRQELVELRKSNRVLEAQLSERKVSYKKLVKKNTVFIKRLQQAKNTKTDTSAKSKQITRLKAQLKAMNQQARNMEQQFTVAVNEAVKQAVKQSAANADKSLMAQKQNNGQLQAQLQAQLQDAGAIIQDLQSKLQHKASQVDLAADTAADAAQVAADAAAQITSEQNSTSLQIESLRAQIIGLERIVEEKNQALEEASKELDHWKVNMDVLLSRITEQQDGMQELREENIGIVKELAARNQELADVSEQLIKTPVQAQ